MGSGPLLFSSSVAVRSTAWIEIQPMRGKTDEEIVAVRSTAWIEMQE